MHKKLASITLLLVASAAALVGCSDSSSETIAGTNPPIDATVCDGDAGCESDMRDLSHKLVDADDANGDGVIDQEELDAARDRMDKEAAEQAASESSAAAAASESAAAEASRSAQAREEAEHSAAAASEAAAAEALNQQQAPEPEPAPAPVQEAPQQEAPAEQAPAQQAPAQPAPQQGGPSMEWATMGPYASEWTCEQARSLWPVDSSACYTGADGSAYFEGMRQAAQ
ncbi:hypothetical protein [Corynebacterium sp. NML 120412]|uniref:hypothetical protein n=1 Tax=Corynebacterium sp. NML 120412 TaxID=2029401 RepID=UPI001177FFFA|nr:hypothetical protein [Corynebacterium sp. NML 120412]